MSSLVVVSSELTDAEREQISGGVVAGRSAQTAQPLAQRSRIVLLVAEGLRTGEVADRLRSTATPSRWRRRFMAERLDGLVDEPRPGQARTITDTQVDAVIPHKLEGARKDTTHWSTRSMATEVGLT
jgi:transposase